MTGKGIVSYRSDNASSMLYEDLSYQCDLSDRVPGGRKELEKLTNIHWQSKLSNKPLAKDN